MTLSSCYFCGTAIEEPLSEYPVVPDAFAPSPDEQGTIVLCPSCHRKLSRVMDLVVDAVDERQRRFDQPNASPESDSTAATDDARSESAAQSSDSAGTAAGIEDDPPSIDEDAADDLLETSSSSESEVTADADSDGTGGAAESASADETDVTVETEASDETSDEPQADDGITVDDGAGSAAERASDGADAGASGGGAEGNAGGATASGGGSQSGGSGGSGGGGGNGGDGPPQATYNRVVRLLQNREFPVERAEIATVATNAYEIPPEDFDAVIETAVDRGVLVEEGQYLKQPE